MTMDCKVCRERLSEYEARELPPADAEAVRRHLESCAECRGQRARLARLAEAVDTLPEEEPPESLSFAVRREVDRLLAPGLSTAPEILTIEELARYLRVPVEAIEDELTTLPAFEVAGELRFRKDRVAEWIRRREDDRVREMASAEIGAMRQEKRS